MEKLNKNFAKPELKDDGTPDYAPAILRVATRHEQKYQECVNPEEVEQGAEPIYEERTTEWYTYETKLKPTASDYITMNYVFVQASPPQDPPPQGYHYEARGWTTDSSSVKRVYEQVPDPLPTVQDYDNAMESHLAQERAERGYTTREPDSYMDSSVPRWAQDARDWVGHRDEVMEYALSVMNGYEQTGEIPPLDEFKANLPKITWTFGDTQGA